MPNLTRRQYLATVTGTSIAAGGLATIALTDTAQAEVSMDSLDVASTQRTLDSPPQSVTLEVTGNYQLQGTTPDQSRIVLQLQHGGTTREPDEILHYSEDIMSGSYTLQADVLSHPEISAEGLMPAEVNQAKATEIEVRVVLLAVTGGEIQSEAAVEDTATLSITKDGVTLELSGTGGLTITE
jgi:hypothetical protein